MFQVVIPSGIFILLPSWLAFSNALVSIRILLEMSSREFRLRWPTQNTQGMPWHTRAPCSVLRRRRHTRVPRSVFFLHVFSSVKWRVAIEAWSKTFINLSRSSRRFAKISCVNSRTSSCVPLVGASSVETEITSGMKAHPGSCWRNSSPTDFPISVHRDLTF